MNFDPRVSSRATLLEVIAEDRPGLLYDLAHTIAAEGCNIELLLIHTEAHKAIDVFYLTRDGLTLDASRQGSLRQRLQAVLVRVRRTHRARWNGEILSSCQSSG